MKPINEKERTLAFVQFLVLFILTVILTIFFVFFDTRIVKKDYEVLREENNRLKGNLITSSDLPNEIDSMREVVMNFKKLPETDYEEQRKRFIDELGSMWMSNKVDTSELSKIKLEMSKVFKEWVYTVGSSIRELNKNSDLKGKDAELKELDDKYNDLKDEYENYKIANPPR